MGDRLRRWWPWVAVSLVLLLTGLVVGPPTDQREPLDPASTQGDGAKALVDVLRELGRDVDVSLEPHADVATAVVLVDELGTARRDAARAWVEAGGRLVVADPTSPLLADLPVAGRLFSDQVGPVAFAPSCPDPELAAVRSVRSSTWVGFAAPQGTTGCFPVADGYWLVRQPVGAGEVVAVGGADAFTNARLGDADNALLAVRLLTAAGGPIVVLDRPPPGAGEVELADLVPDRVYLALLLLAVAFVVGAWAHGRRLGAPVEEALPVRVAASELVLAVGDLMQRSQARDAAATVLRADLRRDLSERLGLPADAAPDRVAAVLAERSGADQDFVAIALRETPVADDESLLRVARAVARLRRRLRRSA